MKRHGRKAQVGDITVVMSRINEGNSKGCWEVEQRRADGEGGYCIRDWVMWEGKRTASGWFNDWKWVLPRPRGRNIPPSVAHLTLGRRGSRPSARRARYRRLP